MMMKNSCKTLLRPQLWFIKGGDIYPDTGGSYTRKRTASGEPVHSFRTLLDDLATVANNRVVAPLADTKPFDLITRPTALQRKAFKLLEVRLERTSNAFANFLNIPTNNEVDSRIFSKFSLANRPHPTQQQVRGKQEQHTQEIFLCSQTPWNPPCG